MGIAGDHRVNIIKLQVIFEWSLEWDCRGQISLPTGMGGKVKNPSSCTVAVSHSDLYYMYPVVRIHRRCISPMYPVVRIHSILCLDAAYQDDAYVLGSNVVCVKNTLVPRGRGIVRTFRDAEPRI